MGNKEVERKLNDKGQLEPHTYAEPPRTMRWKFVLLRNWPLPIFFLLTLIVTIFLIIANGFTTGTLALIGMVVVPTLIIGTWATYWHGMSNFKPFYEIKGVKVEFDSVKYYVPPQVMGPFLQEVFDSFSHIVDFDPAVMFKGVRLAVKDERPYDPLRQVSDEDMVGLTFPGFKRTSYIYGPYALSHGGAGYEMRLQANEFLFPGRSEEKDIEWMRENNVL